jgi:hypothetical protein
MWEDEAKKKQPPTQEQEEEEALEAAQDVPKEPEAPWWELESAPSRAIPVALPLILHMARPGCTIRKLDLSMSSLTLEMGRCLGWALSNSQMESLFLDSCCLTDDSLAALTSGLAQNKHLLELSLRKNKLSGAAEPVSELIHIAGRHASLALLDFAQNPIHPDCIPMLLSLMQYSCSVLSMHILGPGITGPEAKQVALECRTWIDENRKGKDGIPSQEASTGRYDQPGEDEEEEDHFGEDEDELILCRARHVEALTDWRITAPEVRRKKKLPPGVAPLSWMPSGCWICKQCSTVDFRWVVPDRGEGDESGGTGARLFLRPSFADYGRIEMQRERAEGTNKVAFWAQLLVPPGSHYYIFESQIGPRTKMLLCAKDQSSVELAAVTSTSESTQLLDLCKEYGYDGRINVLPTVNASDFKIPEHLEGDKVEVPEADPWAEDPIRTKVLRECFEVDLQMLHLNEICHVDEENEVKETIWNLYCYFYDTYAMYAGRSSWPLIRQVDVYSFFEEASLLDRGPLAVDGSLLSVSEGAKSSANPSSPSGPASPSSPASPASPSGTSPAPSLAEGRQTSLRGQKEVEAGAPVVELLPKVKDAIHPLSTQDIQQMIVQTITRRKHNIRRDATWSQRRKFDVVQATREGGPINRAQFVEVLLRAAVALRGRELSTSRAFQKFTDKILVGRIMQPPLSPFPRGLALKAGAVRDILLARRKSLRQAYERFGSNETSFQRLAQLLKLCDRSFTAKHVASIYALSRRPVKYPTAQSSTLNYDEFSEAVARLALVWQPTAGGFGSGAVREIPAQPKVGEYVNQKAVAARLEAFLERLTERMKPSVVSRF